MEVIGMKIACLGFAVASGAPRAPLLVKMHQPEFTLKSKQARRAIGMRVLSRSGLQAACRLRLGNAYKKARRRND